MTAQMHGELDLASTVAARARGLLAERRMKQGDLTDALGVARTGINNRLTGAKDFDLNELPALADVLDTTVEYLLGMTDVRESKNPRPENRTGVDVRHQGLEPRTRWISDRLAMRNTGEPVVRLIPAPLPPSELEPVEQPKPSRIVSLEERRSGTRTPNQVIKGAGILLRFDRSEISA